MLPDDLYRIQAAPAQIPRRQQGEEFWAKCAALNLYRHARHQSGWARAWSVLTGRPRTLLDLDAFRAVGSLQVCHYEGVRSVAIRQIRGSEGCCQEFDAGFLPLRSHCRERWVRMAAARLMRIPLPPVTLTLVGECYFVVDGRHRISVARAMGQTEIDAEVTVCELAGPQPRELASTARIPALA